MPYLQWPAIRLDLQSEQDIETMAKFMQNGSYQAGGATEAESLYDIAELGVLILNSCGLSTAEKLVCVLQLKDWYSSFAN